MDNEVTPTIGDDEISGGILVIGTEQIDTVVYGGDAVVVGHRALDFMQDRARYLHDDLSTLSNKKLLDIINMSQPISFGKVECDDGETSYIVPHCEIKRSTPSSELLTDLNARLSMRPVKVAELLIHEFNLNQPVWLAAGNAVDSIIKQIDTCLIARGKKPLETIMIAPSLGELMPFMHSGKLEVTADVRPDDPTSYKELMTHLLDLSMVKKCVSPAVDAEQKLPDVPEYPEFDVSLDTPALEQKYVADYVRAIIMREDKLTPYLTAVEKYNVELAHGIQKYVKLVDAYFVHP